MARSPVRTKPPLPILPGIQDVQDPQYRKNNDLCWQASNTMLNSRVAHVDTLLSSSTAITNTTTETTFSKSYTVQPGELNYLGAAFRWCVYGTYSRTTSASILLRMKLAGTIFAVVNPPITVNATNLGWDMEAMFTVRSIGTAGTALQHFGIGGLGAQNATQVNQRQPVAFAIDWTLAQSVTMTAAWQAANAGDTIQIDAWTVEYLYPAGTTA